MKAAVGQILVVGMWLVFANIGGAQPAITSQPTDQTVILGGNASFNVTVTGTGPLIYQWQLNGTNAFTNGIITTVTGTGNFDYFGDGGAATNASVNRPYGVAMDTAGNMLIVDTFNHRIRKVDTNGIITTVAGNGIAGFSGDGGTATNASLNQPRAVTADVFGNIFIADYNNNRVRKVDTNGIISTVAGNGTQVFSGDGGAATNASLQLPCGVAADSLGDLFIADFGNNRIRKVDTNGIISTVAGSGTSPGGGFSGDGGAATNAKLSFPFGVALDNFGNLFVADSNNHRIREVDTNGIITTVAGNGSSGFSGDGSAATNATVSDPQGIFVDAFDYIYIADFAQDRVRQVDANGIITTVAGSGVVSPIDGGYATNSGLWAPEGVALDNFGNILIADTVNSRIRKVFTGRDPVLRLKNVTAKDTGNYQVIVTGPDGSVTSSNALLTVLLPPSITNQPKSVRTVVGSSTNLSVGVSSDASLGYQWFISSGRAATAMPFVIGGRVAQAVVIDGGAGYVSTPQVNFVGGSGFGATATATVLSGRVFMVNVNNGGSGYDAMSPAIQIAPPPSTSTLLPNQTNATLTLPSVTGTDATNYYVVVTNNYGSVTSATVALTVFLQPQNFTAQNVVTGLQMQLTGSPFNPYILQSATNLTPPISWQSISTKLTDANGNWQFIDTNLNGAQKFYRAMGQ